MSINCPKCGSLNWRCWDEQSRAYKDMETGEEFESPVGFLACRDCGYDWCDEPENSERLDPDSYYR